jgi:hypothetical protein
LVDTVALSRIAPLGVDALGPYAGAPGERKLRFVSDQPIVSVNLFGSDVRIDPSAALLAEPLSVHVGV